MAVPISIEVRGVARLNASLIRMGVDVEDLKDAMEAITTAAAAVIAPYTPVQTGALQRSVRGNRAKAKAVVRSGSAAVPYAAAVNYGRRIFYMQQADSHQDRWRLMLEDGVGRAKRRAGL